MSEPKRGPDVGKMTGREIMVRVFDGAFVDAVDRWLAEHDGEPVNNPPPPPDTIPAPCVKCIIPVRSLRSCLHSGLMVSWRGRALFECDFSVRDDGPLASRLSTAGFPEAPWVMFHAGLVAPISETTSALAVPDL